MAGEGAYGPTHQAGQRLAVGRVCRPTGQNDFVHHGPWGWAAMAAESPEAGRKTGWWGGEVRSVAEGGVVPLQLLLPVRGLRVPVLPLVLLTALRLSTGDVVLLVPILALLFLLLLFLLTAMLVLVCLTKGQPN